MNKATKHRSNMFFVIFMSMILMFIGILLGAVLTGIIISVLDITDTKLLTVMSYAPFIGIIIVTLIYIRFAAKQFIPFFFKGLSGNNLKMLGIGLLTGLTMNSICILPAFLVGNLRFSLGNISFEWLLVCFLMVFVQASAEEILDRGYVFFHLRSRYGFKWALMINSIIFSLMHLANDGITLISIINIILIGIFYTFAVHYLDSLWFAMAHHAAWNFTQSFIYGLPNSGLSAENSIIKPDTTTHSLLYDSTFGIEGTLVTTAVILCATIFLYKFTQTRTAQHNDL